ncbi:MAG: esterase [endosymbiont of Escarpia spicata]|uniref:Esterase n=1 Tax=endosymbiont of Escarpia spicata TaxID=2200908 RepID=A0A370DLT7_9GAMM|nr:MAG: esterase [endosymbiont of Escarpia spicata]
MPVELHYREAGDPALPTLILLHGLFGSSANWMGIVKRLEKRFHLIVPDSRNHGRSPHTAEMDYPSTADDLLALMDRLHLDTVHLLGHSMGGKVAMWLALNRSERVEKLVVADIAPVTYPDNFQPILQAMSGLDMERLAGRRAAETLLSGLVPSLEVRQYLLQNLVKVGNHWQWRLNLSGLQSAMPELLGFPDVTAARFPGAALFIHGGNSDYVSPDSRPVIKTLFPYARMRQLTGAGHWLYAEQPDAFSRQVTLFLSNC